MGLKDIAIREVTALMKEFNIAPSRLGRQLFNDPSFFVRLRIPGTRITDVSLDKVFHHAVQMRGQVEMTLIVGKKESRK